jgi:hypothetical protein
MLGSGASAYGTGDQARWNGQVDNIPGGGDRGNLQKASMPDFIRKSGLGYAQQQLLASMLGPGGQSSRQFLNQDLANIRSSTQQQQKQFAGNARFRGSAVGAAIGQSIGQAGVGLESRRLAQADEEELQRKLMINQAINTGFTNKLYQSLGMGNQAYDTMMARAAADKAGPSTFDKYMGRAQGVVGLAGGLAKSFMCWVAREVLRDERWIDARTALIQEGSPRLVNLYMQNGESLANTVRHDPELRAELLPVFEDMAARGAEIRRERGGE